MKVAPALRWIGTVVCTLLAWPALAQPALAQQPSRAPVPRSYGATAASLGRSRPPAAAPQAAQLRPSNLATPSTSRRLPTDVPPPSLAVPGAPAGLEQHPLAPALQFAAKAYQYARDHVRDYTCLLIKRERIEGDLQDPQFIQAKVRMQLVHNGRVVQPLSVFLTFLAPKEIAGRRVLYVAGRNDGKMLVRNGGKRFNYVTVKIEPDSEAALRESLVPITAIGFESATESLMNLIRQDMRRDPAAANTQVKFFRKAKVNGRVCTRISVLHPSPDPALEFSQADVYVDNELHVPIRIEAYDWPRDSAAVKPLLFEYTYTNLQLNVGLTDADFSPRLLDTRK